MLGMSVLVVFRIHRGFLHPYVGGIELKRYNARGDSIWYPRKLGMNKKYEEFLSEFVPWLK